MVESNTAVSEISLNSFDEFRVRESAERMREQLGGSPSCVFAFVTPDYRPRLCEFLEVVQVYGQVPTVVGCSGWGLIGTGQEDENASGFSLMAMRLPHTEVEIKGMTQDDIEVAGARDCWIDKFGKDAGNASGWIVFGNPFVMDHESLLRSFNTSFPNDRIFGGLASGGNNESEVFLMNSKGGTEAGAVALRFEGGIRVGGLVSQGCRPVGEPYTVTGANSNLLYGIGSRAAYEVLEETFESLNDEEQEIARRNMFVGLAVSEYGDQHKTGDFIVRNILGGDPEAGVLAVGALPRVGQTMQFQVRDRDAADIELRRLCLECIGQGEEPFGGLLFSCTGRGSHLFGVPNHDASTVEEVFGRIPIAGFFCNGEIGPVGGKNFMHGYSASLALFYNA